jgi:hypothetical protein
MPSGVELAGAIGTWAAVLLALVALGGILPGLILYRTSKSQKARALALVDDPDKSFVRHINLSGLRLSRVSGLPDLREPPNLRALSSSQPPDLSRLGSQQSTTCWINFASVARAMFPDIRIIDGADALEYKEGQAYFPVHCLWILLFGVLHRYAVRSDKGLPIDEVSQRTIDLDHWDTAVSGISGSLLMRNGTTGRQQIELLYETHPLSALKQALKPSDIPLANLILFSLGYIQLKSGTYITMRDAERHQSTDHPRPLAQQRHTRKNDSAFARRLQIAELYDSSMEYRHASILKRMGLSIPNVKCYVLSKPERVLPRDLWPQCSPKLLRNKGYHKTSSRREVWMERKEVQRIVCAYLRQTMSPDGILYGCINDRFVNDVLESDGLRRTLRFATSMLAHLEYPEPGRLELQSKLDAVAALELGQVRWSRRAMNSFHALDEAVRSVFTTGNFGWKSVSILYAYDKEFRKRLVQMMGSVVEGGRPMVRFDVARNQVVLSGSYQQPDAFEAPFDFAYAFEETHPYLDIAEWEMSLVHASFAALQGHLLAVMWNMCMSSSALHRLLDFSLPDGICLLGGSTTERYLDPTQELPGPRDRQEKPVRRYITSTEHDDSSDSKSDDPENSGRSAQEERDGSQLQSKSSDIWSDTEERQLEHPSPPREPAGGPITYMSQWEATVAESLKVACMSGHVEIVRLLIGDAASRSGVGPGLILAAERGHTEVVQLLLGPYVDRVMGQGGLDIVVCIVLENACWYGQIEIVRMLLDRVDSSLDLSINCLMNASGNGQTEVVQLLLEFEATRKAKEAKATPLLKLAVLSTISESDGL